MATGASLDLFYALAFIICMQKGMSAFEGCQHGRCAGIWIGHVLPQRPNVCEVDEILLGIAVMTQPLH